MNKLYSVHDHWTDINKKNDVDIESIDGVITRIKVNDEDYGGGGSSDFSTAELIFSKSGVSGSFMVSWVYDDGENHSTMGEIVESGTYNIILYRGNAFALFKPEGAGDFNIVGTGDVEVDGTDIYITGDCTITIS